MKIVATCGLGMGSSMMLKMSIEDALKEAGIKAELESVDLGSAKSMNADIYVLSKDLERNASEFGGEVLVIDNISDSQEVKEKLLKAIENLESKQQK